MATSAPHPEGLPNVHQLRGPYPGVWGDPGERHERQKGHPRRGQHRHAPLPHGRPSAVPGRPVPRNGESVGKRRSTRLCEAPLGRRPPRCGATGWPRARRPATRRRWSCPCAPGGGRRRRSAPSRRPSRPPPATCSARAPSTRTSGPITSAIGTEATEQHASSSSSPFSATASSRSSLHRHEAVSSWACRAHGLRRPTTPMRRL